MQPGKVVFIALLTSGLTSAGVFFGLRTLVGPGLPGASVEAPPKASPSAAATEKPPADKPVNVPPLVGSNLTNALLVLMNQGIKVDKIRRTKDDKVPLDEVISTDPPAGSSVAAGASISLLVSTGPELREVPKVVGQGFTRAKKALEEAGFAIKSRFAFDDDRPDGIVLRQTPEAEARAAPGSTVELVINREP